MVRTFMLISLVLVGAASAAFAQQHKPKPAPKVVSKQFAADRLSIFGVEVGQSYSPDDVACVPRPTEFAGFTAYEPKPGRPFCLQVSQNQSNADARAVWFADTLPDPFHDNMTVQVAQSPARGIIIYSFMMLTRGVQDQNAIFDAFKAKFGDPQLLNKQESETMVGAKFDTLDAEWDFADGAKLMFNGTAGRINLGDISGLSAAAVKANQDNAPKRQAL